MITTSKHKNNKSLTDDKIELRLKIPKYPKLEVETRVYYTIISNKNNLKICNYIMLININSWCNIVISMLNHNI